MNRALRKRKRSRRKTNEWRMKRVLKWGFEFGLIESMLFVGWRQDMKL